MPIPPTTTLQAIQTKVRRLTRSPSTAQLTDLDLQNYINTFVVYDFPEHLRTFNLRTTFAFYTNPYQDTYRTDEISFGDPVANPTIVYNPLYNFQNKYISVHPPIYVAGYQTLYTQSREQFYGYYPNVNSIALTANAGDGVTTSFTGVVNALQSTPGNVIQNVGLVQGQVLFDSADSNLNGLALVDVPVINATTGNPTVDGNLYDPASAAYQAALLAPPTVVDVTNTINYATGVYTITFGTAPGSGIPINSQTNNQRLGMPQAMLYYGNTFVIRPVPDQPYRIDIEVYKRPTALLATSQSPELEEYWQYIAFSAAKKILEDRMDMDSVQLLLPALKEQERLIGRRTIVQYTNERVATIYTEQTSPTTGGFSGWGSGGSSL
jgi:hypothetical protein